MASFTLGLTKSAVAGTISRVKSAIEEEDKQRVRVQDDLVFITGEFEMMQSFLGVTNAERANNPVVRTWVRQLRELAFDVEDCVEFVIHLDKPSRWDWVQRLVSSLTCMASPQLPLDAAAAEIKRLKARVEDVSQRNIRYNLISDDNNSQSTTSGTIATSSSSTGFSILSQVWEASGKRRDSGRLRNLITGEGADLQVISLWGSCSTTGGAAADHLGATSSPSYIVREAYNDPEICREFKMRAWVKVVHPFNHAEFIRTLLAQFYINCHQPIIGADLSNKMKAAAVATDNDELMQQVSKQRYLLVLEDVSDVIEWDAIKMYLPDSNNGSRIVVSTQHIRISLMCAGNSYQVSQLARFSDGQSICAFSKKGSVCRSDLGEFNWQIRCRGVVSVHTDVEYYLFRQVYWCIAHKRRGFEGVVFGEHSWVDVPYRFDLNAFAVRLFLNFQSRDVEAKAIEEVGRMGDQGVIERCRRYLREADCLVVLNGLRSMEDWDTIKDTFLSSGPTKGSSCIIVITHDGTVAKHCVGVQQNRALSHEALKGDEVLRRLIEDSTCSRGMEDSCWAHLFYDVQEERDYYAKELKLVGREKEQRDLTRILHHDNPGVISLWGPSGVGKSALARNIYYDHQLDLVNKRRCRQAFSLVSVPCPFNLVDFSWRLLLDFYTFRNDDYQKEAAAVWLMKGEVDPIESCRWWLTEKECWVVIDGLRSEDDWDQIRTKLLFELPAKSSSNNRIIVITREKSVASHCVYGKEDALFEVRPLIKARSSPLIGRGKEMSDLRETTLGVTCLWGIAGVGKTTLARHLYDDDYIFVGRSPKYLTEIPQKETELLKIGWVDVPRPFNLTEFSQRLLLGFHWNDQDKETAAIGIIENQDTIQVCCKFIREYKCLIIIDDLTSTRDWDLIKATFFLPEPTQSHHVIVVTSEERVAIHCASEKSKVHNVKVLDAGDALDLFTQIAWGGKQLALDELEFSNDIMAKCGGLPKVIVAIGEYVAEEIANIGNQKFRKETTLTSISEDIHHDFMGTLERDPRYHNLKGIFSWMQSYLDACSDSLKPCIFYLPVFPSGHKRIRCKRLMRRWIAEGYSRDTFGGGTADENGDKLFDELVESSIIQQRKTRRSSRTAMCQVNGFFHEYIISRPMEDNRVLSLEGRCRLNSQRTGQHLAIRSCWNRDKVVFESIDFSRLRSLTVFGKWMPFFISSNNNMRLLRVLDLEDTDSGVKDDDLEHIVKLVPRLKFLSLRGCKDITRLPDSLGGLKQLQTLDVKRTKIVTMPRSIIELVKLQYVRADPISDEVDIDGQPTPDEDACASTLLKNSKAPSQENDGMITSQPPPFRSAEGDDISTNKQPETIDGNAASTSQPGGTYGDGTTTQGDGASTSQPAEDQAPRRSRASNLVSYSCSWLSKKKTNDGGVKVPAGIGNLTALLTLGVVSVSGAGGKAILKEMKKLTQLRKLRVSSINQKNLKDLCTAISRHDHLESLSMRLDKVEDVSSFFSSSIDMFTELPKTLKSLKLYTEDPHVNVQVSLALLKQLIGNLNNLRKVGLELTVSTHHDIYRLNELPNQVVFLHLCVKPTEDGKLYYGQSNGGILNRFDGRVIKIDCGMYKLAFVLESNITDNVEVLVVHCSTTESSLKLSGLENVPYLKEVWLTGSYSTAVKQYLQREVDGLGNRMGRVVQLKLKDQPSSS